MKKILFYFLFPAMLAIAACDKANDHPTKIPDVTGVWETDESTSPGWIVGFRESGEFCELEKTVTAWPDCAFTWNQSNDSVFIIGAVDRLWLVESDSDTSFIAIVVDQCGDHVAQMRFIK